MKIEIDNNSGFCFGVVNAIQKAEVELGKNATLYCLGDIVHNASEVERLQTQGLRTITHSQLSELKNSTVLLRAHGEPPSTYDTAKRNSITIIDATCPVVLQLQRRIKQAYTHNLLRLQRKEIKEMPLILIYGKPGHAEVNGLVGQTEGNAIVIHEPDDLNNIDFNRDIILYSQTTKSLDGFHEIIQLIKERKTKGSFEYFDTICRQVSNRLEKIREFAGSHDAIIFVCGAKSSNGKVLYEECRKVNHRSFLISDGEEIDLSQLNNTDSIGICGATSTPRWLMTNIAQHIADTLDPSKALKIDSNNI